MRRRRSPAVGVNAVLLVLCCIPYIPLIAAAQQQRSSSAHDDRQWPTRLPHHEVEQSISLGANSQTAQRNNNQNNNNNNYAASTNDVRALATLAPSGRLETHNGDVRAPPARTSGPTAGLSSRLPARNLRDWEVEDTVLMATVDGMIHARDRKTGAPRWILESDRPMVETIYHANDSTDEGSGGARGSTQKFYWIVEPSQDGSLYGYTPGAPLGMVKLGLTVKQLVDELSPYHSDEPPVVYTGDKKTTLYNIDVHTGNVLKIFTSDGSRSFDGGICRQMDALDALDDDECGKTASLTLGRTDYTVGIQSSITGQQICTIKYFEWTSNNRDRDLFSQYSETKDNRYIYSLHDGRVMALDHLRPGGPEGDAMQKPMYKHKFQSPVVRVFDVIRPTRSTSYDTPLVILPQPISPALTDDTFLRDDSKVFVNCTENGSWYALSEIEYPMVTDDAKIAQCARSDFSHKLRLLDGTEEELKKAIVGVHALSYPDAWPADVPTISAPEEPAQIIPRLPDRPVTREDLIPLSRQPRAASAHDSYAGGILGLLLFFVVLVGAFWKFPLRNIKSKALPEAPNQAPELPAVLAVENTVQNVTTSVSGLIQQPETSTEIALPGASDDALATELSVSNVADLAVKKVSFVEENKENESPLPGQPSTERADTASTLELTLTKTLSTEASLPAIDSTPKLKKKAHRGQRGGKKEAEKRKLKQGSDPGDEIDGIVAGVKQMGQDVTVTPDAVSKSANPDPDGPNDLHNLVFSTDKVLGTGSGGTVVYEGKFEGRDVAVKRMLTVHYELASQEVSLLEQSEDHPNVIRYFCRREDRHFLYIALELCQASLFDLFKDNRHDTTSMPDEKYLPLIEDITRQPVLALRQLAEGIKHLHALRIVHRDIKPQNMLIAYPKKNTISTFPRIIISDFGLCKTLPEGASTLIGATVNAGTTGWKAPELIHQPRDASLANGSQHSVSNGSMNASGDPQPGAPGVKRAVDIFSLGCVFFYVLTKGMHPFDDEEGWMALRERNIKTNRCNLSAIELHGPDTVDLIKWMLAPKPEDRPTAAEVLAHPFFWTPEDRLEFLSLASDRFDQEPRDPPSHLLNQLEARAESIIPPGPTTVSTSPSPGRQQPWAYAAHKRSPSEHATYNNGSPPPYSLGSLPPAYPSYSSTSYQMSLPIPEANFLSRLDAKFIDTLGRQRKYNGSKLADLLRALRNKHHHWDDMPEDVKARVGEVPEGYLRYWELRFPGLMVGVWRVVKETGIGEERRFWRWFGGRA